MSAALPALTTDDIETIIDGIENFIMDGDPDVDAIWQPYIDKLRATGKGARDADSELEGRGDRDRAGRDVVSDPQGQPPVAVSHRLQGELLEALKSDLIRQRLTRDDLELARLRGEAAVRVKEPPKFHYTEDE